MLKVFLILLFACSVFGQDTSKILLTFNEPMSMLHLLDTGNYKVTDGIIDYPVYKVGVTKDTAQVVLFCKRVPYKKPLLITVTKVRDRAGNFIGDKNKITFLFNGFSPTQEIPSSINLRR